MFIVFISTRDCYVADGHGHFIYRPYLTPVPAQVINYFNL